MNHIKTKLIAVLIIFILSFLFHYLYEWLPNPVFSIFFPVNESIWEHMKLLFTPIIFYGAVDYYLMTKYKIKFNNFLFALFISSLISIPIYLAIYLPFYYILGENLVVSILILLIVIIIAQVINYYIQKRNNIYIDIISCIFIIITFIVFGYLTYYPLKTNLFYDKENKLYGINTHYLGD